MTRIHILGASGAGTTTLGLSVADALGVPHLDTDHYFWLPTEPPFTTPRPVAARLSLLSDKLSVHPAWVLSGSAVKWGDSLSHMYDLIVFLTLNPALRMDRLRQREHTRYGPRVAPGGDMHASSAAFLAWAATYDTAGLEQRSRAAHEDWLARCSTPVIRLDSSAPLATLRQEVLSSIETRAARTDFSRNT